jgi:hypothetical protein
VIACVRCGEAPEWGVSSISYPHHPGELSHYCDNGQRVSVSLDELSGAELEWARKLVDESEAASRANVVELCSVCCATLATLAEPGKPPRLVCVRCDADELLDEEPTEPGEP